jgi:hypothetical protein
VKFGDFPEGKRGEERGELYWQNREWVAVREAWIEYQKAMRKCEHSRAFKALLNELKRVWNKRQIKHVFFWPDL